MPVLTIATYNENGFKLKKTIVQQKSLLFRTKGRLFLILSAPAGIVALPDSAAVGGA